MNLSKALRKISFLIGTKKVIISSSKTVGRINISPSTNTVHVFIDSYPFQGISLVLPNDVEMPIGKMLIVSYDNTLIGESYMDNNQLVIAIQQIDEPEMALAIPFNIKMVEEKGYSSFVWLGREIGWEVHGLSILKTIGDGNSLSTPLPDEEGGPPNP